MEVRLRRLFLLYVVVFNGFVGYSLMITVFTPLLVDGRAPCCRRRPRIRYVLCCSGCC